MLVADTATKLAEHNSKYSVARILRVARMKTDQLSPILYELNRFYIFRFCVTYGMQRHVYDDIISQKLFVFLFISHDFIAP